MFESSFLLAIKAILINILVPLVPGILFLWIFFGTKFKGILLYILARAVGTGVVAFSLFNLQFIRFGIGMGEYFAIVGILLAVFIALLYIKKLAIKDYLKTLKIHFKIGEIKESYVSISKFQKILFWGGMILGLGVVILSLVRSTSLPTYADDSFANRNGPALNIYQDGGVKLFGDTTEILGRGKLGYPIYIPVYKAVVSDIMGGYNDIYINLWQWLILLSLLVFVIKITWDRTKNLFHTILPVIGICGLPILFFHAGEGYMELPSAMFSVLTIWAFYEFLEKKEYGYIALGVLLGSIMSQIKNDGFIVYLPGIIISFIIMLGLRRNLSEFFRGFVKSVKNLWSSVFYVIRFLLPFLVVKIIHGIGFNQAAGVESGVGLSQTIHWEIFSVFGNIFLSNDNYNVALILLGICLFFGYKMRRDKTKNLYLILAPLMIGIFFILVFLFTENYLVALNQTTINRVFTMTFVILLAFIGYIHTGNETNA